MDHYKNLENKARYLPSTEEFLRLLQMAYERKCITLEQYHALRERRKAWHG